MIPEQALRACGLPREDALALLQHACARPRSWLVAHADEPLPAAAAAAFAAMCERRRRGEPVAYIVGRRGFWTLDLECTPAALIPRPETERLVELALDRLHGMHAPRVADLGTGTGAVALAVARECPAASVVATDASAAALVLARRNAARNDVRNVAWVRADWLSAFAGGAFDLIVANPPYVATGDPHLDRGDLRFEPRSALASGPTGLDALSRIAADARRCLKPGGALLVEHGCDQRRAVSALLAGAGLAAIATSQDLAGLDRVTAAHRAGA